MFGAKVGKPNLGVGIPGGTVTTPRCCVAPNNVIDHAPLCDKVARRWTSVILPMYWTRIESDHGKQI